MRSEGQGLQGGRRILVYGVTGSGKTTLAERLSRLVGTDWVSVDDATWQPGRVAPPGEEQRRRFEDVCAGESCILDTAYAAWVDIALSRAELVAGLDHRRHVSLRRLLRRPLVRNLDHRPVFNGNVETWRQTFSADSIILWHLRSPRRPEQWLGTVAAETEQVA